MVYVHGAPNLPDPTIAGLDKSTCKVTLVEVGFCADLRLGAKRTEKSLKYHKLVETLKDTWGDVQLICIPIGAAGTVLSSSMAELTTRFFRESPSNTKLIRGLATQLSSLAAHRLDGIILHRQKIASMSLDNSQPATTQRGQSWVENQQPTQPSSQPSLCPTGQHPGRNQTEFNAANKASQRPANKKYKSARSLTSNPIGPK